jgi:predicted acyl esterase
VAELWVASTATDGDFIATLQDVAPNGMLTSSTCTIACARRSACRSQRLTTTWACRGIRSVT